MKSDGGKILDVRNLGPEELSELAVVGRSQPDVTRLRDSYHRIAFYYACGKTLAEVAELVGYSTHRVRQLRASPMLDQLIAEKRAALEKAEIEAIVNDEIRHQQRRILAAATRRIMDEVLDDERDIPLNRLLAVHDSTADRLGYAKHSTQMVVKADFASLLDEAIARSAKIVEGRTFPPALEPADRSLIPVAAPAEARSSGVPTPPPVFRRRI